MMENQSKPSHSSIYDSYKQRILAIKELRSALRYRNLIFQLVRRDKVTRVRRSTLGILWTMLNPLGTILILSLVFSQMFNMGDVYPAYILTKLIVWNILSLYYLQANLLFSLVVAAGIILILLLERGSIIPGDLHE
jgi:hypothetical protein